MFTTMPSSPADPDVRPRRKAAAAILPRNVREIQPTALALWLRRGAPGGGAGPDTVGRAVREACLELLRRGIYPTKRRLLERLPGVKPGTLRRYRDWVLAEIRNPPPAGPSLVGVDAEERAEIQRRIAAVRAEKVARGEVPIWALGWRVPEVSARHVEPRLGGGLGLD